MATFHGALYQVCTIIIIIHHINDEHCQSLEIATKLDVAQHKRLLLFVFLLLEDCKVALTYFDMGLDFCQLS